MTSPVRWLPLVKRLWQVFGISDWRLCRDVPLTERIVDLHPVWAYF